MINIGVICDNSWDNFILINNKFKKLNSENFRIHAIYGKTLEIINNCSSKNYLNLIRHYSDNLSKTIYNLLNACDRIIVLEAGQKVWDGSRDDYAELVNKRKAAQ